MMMRQIVVWAAVLITGGVTAASDALAQGVGAQVPRPTIQGGALNQNIKPPNNTYFDSRPSTAPQTMNPNSAGFSASGPHTGPRYIGNVK
ncbi:hypothetical protein ACVIHF_007152 [Bradyrhizobium sp. USDA 4506]